MASPASAEDVQQSFNNVCCYVSTTIKYQLTSVSIAFLVFDYLVTFDREYRLVWKRRFSAATMFFLLARYMVIMDRALNAPTMFPLTPEGCSAVIWSDLIFELLQPLLWASFSGLRVYAMSGRQRPLALLVFILLLPPFGLFLVENICQTPTEAPSPDNCVPDIAISPQLLNTLFYASRSAVIVADVLVLAVTIQKTYRTREVALEANVKSSFSSLLLRDGAIYFVMLLFMNITDIIMVLTQIYPNFGACYIDPMTAVLVSRFILNLREINVPEDISTGASRPSFIRSIRFASFVEPLGAPLDHDLSVREIERSDAEIELEEMPGGSEDVVVG